MGQSERITATRIQKDSASHKQETAQKGQSHPLSETFAFPFVSTVWETSPPFVSSFPLFSSFPLSCSWTFSPTQETLHVSGLNGGLSFSGAGAMLTLLRTQWGPLRKHEKGHTLTLTWKHALHNLSYPGLHGESGGDSFGLTLTKGLGQLGVDNGYRQAGMNKGIFLELLIHIIQQPKGTHSDIENGETR